MFGKKVKLELEIETETTIKTLARRMEGLKEIVFVHIQSLDYVSDGILPGDTLIWDPNKQELGHLVDYKNDDGSSIGP
jgi:hypothetical protein